MSESRPGETPEHLEGAYYVAAPDRSAKQNKPAKPEAAPPSGGAAPREAWPDLPPEARTSRPPQAQPSAPPGPARYQVPASATQRPTTAEPQVRPSVPTDRAGASAPPTKPRRKRRYRRLLWLAIPLVPLLIVLGLVGYAAHLFNGIERVPLKGQLDPVSGNSVNYLLVGSDARDGVSGRRSDTIILMRVEPERTLMMSIPRDLLVTIAETGHRQKINAAYNGGAPRLVATVKDALGVPINRYAEVTFATFGPIVDALGGIEITFPHGAYDKNTGFRVPGPGTHRLDGFNALAYVRSRHYVEIIDGQDRPDPTSDLGRQQRQQAFLMRTFQKVGQTRNPATLLHIGSALRDGLTVDDEMGAGDALSLVRKLAGKTPVSMVLPTYPDRFDGQSVLRLKDQSEVKPILDNFR